MKFIKKRWGDILFLVVLAFLLIPQTRLPLQVFVQRIISFSPSEISKTDRVIVEDYNWALSTLDGNVINLSKSEGNVVVINTWATWCPPCIAEMPSLQKLYDIYGDKVDFYFISAENPENLIEFMEEKGYTFPVFIQAEQAPKTFRSQALPTTYLLAKNGEIIIKKVGAAKWDSDRMLDLLGTEIAR